MISKTFELPYYNLLYPKIINILDKLILYCDNIGSWVQDQVHNQDLIKLARYFSMQCEH